MSAKPTTLAPRLVRLTDRGRDIRNAAIAIGDEIEAEPRRTAGAKVVDNLRLGLDAVVEAGAFDPAPLLRALRELDRGGEAAHDS